MVEAPRIVFDAKTAANYLGVNEQTIRKLAREGSIPAFRVGDSWRFRKTTLDEWVARQESGAEGRRILIVDDDPRIRELLTRLLYGEGCRVSTAESGKSALVALAESEFDLLLLDLELGDMDGAAVLNQISQRKLRLPVVLITGFPDGQLVDRAMQFAPLLLLRKPIDKQQLLLTVRSTIRPTIDRQT
jgi:excisionase family DNA binding protein